MFVDILKVIFYAAIAIPFVYMAYEVSFYLIKSSLKLFSGKLKPAFIMIYTSLIKS
jgi:hypothetical protein